VYLAGTVAPSFVTSLYVPDVTRVFAGAWLEDGDAAIATPPMTAPTATRMPTPLATTRRSNFMSRDCTCPHRREKGVTGIDIGNKPWGRFHG
jgi:hypothetical protein